MENKSNTPDKVNNKKKLLIIGGGYAGFWSALSAIRQSREIEQIEQLEVTLVNPDNYFTMRPRLYEVSLEGLRVKLDDYLKPLGIHQIIGKAEAIHPDSNEVIIGTLQGTLHFQYDYLILAAGSSLRAYNIPGLANTFNVDTFNNAQHLEDHLVELAKSNFKNEGDTTFVVVGAGFTGLESVTCIEEKAQLLQTKYATTESKFKVILIEKHAQVASFYSPEGREYIHETLRSKNIEIITESELASIEPSAAVLSNGVRIPTSTVIWAAGMVASPLTSFFKGERDPLNRIYVDDYLKLAAYKNVIIAGDVANVKVGNGQTAVMSCQFSQFQGRWAGHNAVNDIFEAPLKKYVQDGYNTCLDLGRDTALITDGWDRVLEKTGKEAKAVKEWICTDLIYPYDDVEEALADSYPRIPKF